MLKTRAITHNDIDKIKELIEKYYPNIDYPDFLSDLLCGFIIEDSNNELIMAGGIQQLAEILLVTDKSKSRIKIGKALVEAQRISCYVSQKFGINELIAFTDNDDYARHLIQHGFRKNLDQTLQMKVPYGS